MRAGAESKRGASPIPDLITGPAASTNPFSLQVSLPTALTTAHKLISACIFQNQVCGEQMLKMKWRGEGGRKQKPTHTNNSNTVKCLTTCKSFKATNTLSLSLPGFTNRFAASASVEGRGVRGPRTLCFASNYMPS